MRPLLRVIFNKLMTQPNVLWISVSAHLRCFDQRLLSRLAGKATVRRWEYYQSLDEPCCVQSIVDMLYAYVSDRARLESQLKDSVGHEAYKLHLVGHGVSGIVALLYAQQHPEHVASLTLLSIAANPAVNWQAHYYALRNLLPCSREMVLAQMTRLLFGPQSIRLTKALSQLLASDLDSAPTLHSLAHHTQILPGQVSVPLLICNGEFDAVVGSHNDVQWQKWRVCSTSDDGANDTDLQLWRCPEGNHFFHFYHAAAVATALEKHWKTVMQQSKRSHVLC